MRQINLLPGDLQKAESKKIIRNVIIATVVPVALVIASLHILMTIRVNGLESEVAVRPTLIDTPETNQLRQDIGRLKKELGSFVDQNEMVVDLLAQRLSTRDILILLSEVTVDRVWLSSVTVSAEAQSLEIQGKSFNTRLVSEFMLDLKKMPHFENVKLNTMDKDAKGKEEVDFSITCRLK